MEDAIINEMEKISVQPRWVSREQVTDQEINRLIAVYKSGYGPKWISEEHFRSTVIKNTSEILELVTGEDVAAAINVNNKRITDIAVNPKFQGQGLGVRLFEEAAKHIPEVWISVGIDPKAEGMMATVTDPRLSFLPVGDKTTIESLFKGLNGVESDLIIGTDRVKHKFLTGRLVGKGITQEEFIAFYRPNSLHGVGYEQILFQNQPL